MGVEYTEGQVFDITPTDIGGSDYILLTKEFKRYIGYTGKEQLIVKCDNSKKYGKFIGIGLKR